jgi:hypothetical protein
MRLESVDQATQWAITMKQQLGSLSGMLKLDKMDITGEGEDLHMLAAVASSNLGTMFKQMKALAGMAGGGGGMATP